MCQDILENGTDTKGEKVRPKWEDTGEFAYTIKRFGVVNFFSEEKLHKLKFLNDKNSFEKLYG